MLDLSTNIFFVMMAIHHLLIRYILVSIVYCVYIYLCNVSTTGAVGPAYKVIICVYTHTLAGIAHSLSHLGIVCIDKGIP